MYRDSERNICHSMISLVRVFGCSLQLPVTEGSDCCYRRRYRRLCYCNRSATRAARYFPPWIGDRSDITKANWHTESKTQIKVITRSSRASGVDSPSGRSDCSLHRRRAHRRFERWSLPNPIIAPSPFLPGQVSPTLRFSYSGLIDFQALVEGVRTVRQTLTVP